MRRKYMGLFKKKETAVSYNEKYLLDEMNAVVSVIRVMYSGRDIKRQLSASYWEFSEAGNKLCETSERE